MSECRLVMDEDIPTYSCCGMFFPITDLETHCTECGGQFDWSDCIEAWNPEDYEHLLTQEQCWNLGIDIDIAHYDEDDDEDTPAWAYNDYGKNGNQLDLDSYLGLPFKDEEPLGSWGGGSALPPTAHLRDHHRPQEHQRDPFLDVAIPDEVL